MLISARVHKELSNGRDSRQIVEEVVKILSDGHGHIRGGLAIVLPLHTAMSNNISVGHHV